MSKATYPRDSFDELPEASDRVGAHRAENPRLRPGIVVLWAVVAVVVLMGVGIVSSMALAGRLNTSAPVAAVTEHPTPTVTPVIDRSYSVLILNATGKAGLATAMKEKLVQAGWQASAVSPGDASSVYPTTTVYYGRPGDAAAAAGLAQLIGGARVVASAQYQPADDPQAKQLTIVVGTDRAGAATPAPGD